jgi:hypothetical protein
VLNKSRHSSLDGSRGLSRTLSSSENKRRPRAVPSPVSNAYSGSWRVWSCTSQRAPMARFLRKK